MANVALFANWTWKAKLPEPFDKVTNNVSTTHYSKYCTVSAKKATLHAYVLQAILSYIEMDTSVTPGSTSQCAIGTQKDRTVAEYASRTGEIHAVVFTRKTGKFIVGRFDDLTSPPRTYSLTERGNTGSALFFALMPIALEDDEFRESYDLLGRCKNAGYSDMDEAEKAAFILCDNLYRRITSATTLSSDGIPINLPSTGNLQQISPMNLRNGTYTPGSTLFGTFQILKGGSSASGSLVIPNKNDFVGKYPLSSRTLSAEESLMVPTLEDWYVIPPEVVTICQHAHLTTPGIQPMRNFMMRGPAGTGKTEGAKAIAAGLGLPYMYYTCACAFRISFLSSPLRYHIPLRYRKNQKYRIHYHR